MKDFGIVRGMAELGDVTLIMNHTEADGNTLSGTLSVIRDNKFHFDKVDFKPGDVFVDLGCNLGMVSMYVAKKFPFVKVVSFDASPIATQLFWLSNRDNGIKNITIYNDAIGIKPGRMKFHNDADGANCLVSCELSEDPDMEKRTEFEVNVIPLYALFLNPVYGIDKIKYLKMDIEGGEWEIFRELLFKKRMPEVLNKIEYLHLEIHAFKGYDVEQLKSAAKKHFGDKVFFDV